MSKLFIGNWKMYLNDDEAVQLARGYVEAAAGLAGEVAVAPTFTAIGRVGEVLAGAPVSLGAQDVFWEVTGAYTGEVSATNLAKSGVRYVIIGHSERRQWFGETDAMVVKKVAAAIRDGLVPVICVGETAEEKAAGQREAVVERQARAVFGAVTFPETTPVVIAYEPRWAIGTGLACEPDEAVAVHGLIRGLVKAADPAAAGRLKVLYGGSVNSGNITQYVARPEVDGVLVGGASTKIDEVRVMLVACS